MKSEILILSMNNEVVGTIADSFQSDGVWFGRFHSNCENATATTRRVNEYIHFCEEWNERIRMDNAEADPAEFEKFSDLIDDALWEAKAQDLSRLLPIEKAPVFFVGGEISFRTV